MQLTSQELAEKIVSWLEDKKADNIEVYDLRGKTSYTDFAVLCTGNSSLHNRALGTYLQDKIRENKIHLFGDEGMDNGQWILLDVYDVIVHIFLAEVRERYKMDDFCVTIQTKPLEEEEVHDKE